MKQAKIIATLVLVIALLLPGLSACKVDVFPGGKEALFEEKYQPKSALAQLLSGDKYKKLADFDSALGKATTPIKVDCELKVNKLSIMEGMDLNGSNKLSSSLIHSDSKSEGNIDLSIMGNNLKADYYIDGDTMAIEYADMLGKYLKIPTSGFSLPESDIPLPSFEILSPEDLTAFDAAIDELSKKAIEIIKDNIPDTNIENKKEKIEYSGKTVNADIVVIKLNNEQLKKIVIDILKYIKDDSRFEKVLSATSMFSVSEQSYSDTLDEAIKDFESDDDVKKLDVELTATFVKSKLVAAKMVMDTDDGLATFSFDYEETDGINSFKFNGRGPEDETFTILYKEDTNANEYKLSFDTNQESFGFDLTLTIPDENNFKINLKTEGLQELEFNINITIEEVTDKSLSYKISFTMDDKADIELSFKFEILDSYTFKNPTLTEENSYDITDPDQLAAFAEELGDSFSWLADLLGLADVPSLGDLEIEYIEDEEYETNGELMPAAFADVLDGEGGFNASANNVIVQLYNIENEVLYSYMNMEEQVYDSYYFDGEAWFLMDSENLKLEPIETVELWLSELMLFADEAEFVESGLATDGTIDLVYEIFSYPTFESEVCYLFDEDGALMYVSDGVNNYHVMLSDTVDSYITEMINEYTK